MENLDFYTERLAPGFWGEPLNAVSNLAFFLAAIAVWALMRKTKTSSVPLMSLAILIFVVGIGSSIFHTFATRWAWYFDFIPICVYIVTFFWFYLRRIVAWGPWATLTTLVFLIGGSIGLGFHDPSATWFYVPTLIFSMALGAFHWRQRKKEPWTMLIAAAVFAVSVAFRTIDPFVGSQFPWGTHFLWHLLNGVVLYLGTRALILN